MPDYGFIAQPPQTNSLQSIAGMLDFAGKAQALQAGAVELQKRRALLEPEIARGKAESQVSQQTAQPRIEQAGSQARAAETASQHASFQLQRDQASTALNEAAGLVTDPGVLSGDPAKTTQALVAARKRAIAKGVPADHAEMLFGHLLGQVGTQGAVVDQLRNIALANSGAGTQAGITNAPVTPINNGQQIEFKQLQPGAPGAVQPGQGMQMQIPPTAPTFNPQTNTPGYMGPTPPQRPGFVPSGPALGVPENVAGSVGMVNQDWQATAANAQKAAQDIGVLQEIKKYAGGAATGVLSDRQAFIAGLGGLVGMSPAELEKTNTDLLAKNSNMLALAGGDTNLARTMAEMANPNTHMTKEAIEKAANQVIAQRQLALVKQRFLGQFKDDPTQYTRALSQFNSVADPRVLQLESMGPKEKARMKAAMSPQEQQAFGQKIRAMYQMGILK